VQLLSPWSINIDCTLWQEQSYNDSAEIRTVCSFSPSQLFNHNVKVLMSHHLQANMSPWRLGLGDALNSKLKFPIVIWIFISRVCQVVDVRLATLGSMQNTIRDRFKASSPLEVLRVLLISVVQSVLILRLSRHVGRGSRLDSEKYQARFDHKIKQARRRDAPTDAYLQLSC